MSLPSLTSKGKRKSSSLTIMFNTGYSVINSSSLKNPELIFDFPDWEILPFDHFSPHPDILSRRLTIMTQWLSQKPGIYLIPIQALIQKVPPTSFIDSHAFDLKQGDALNKDQFTQKLIASSYEHVAQVNDHGQFCVRGGIIDVFPWATPSPTVLSYLTKPSTAFVSLTQSPMQYHHTQQIHCLPANEFPLTETSISLLDNNGVKPCQNQR